jgi:ABC-2 type transport system permease protein
MSGGRTIGLVAMREIRERLRSKAFIASTLLILALLAVSAVIGRLFDPQRTFDYAVTAPAPPGLVVALEGAAEPFDDAKVKLRTVESAAAGRKLLDDGKVDALLILSTDRLVFRKNVDAQVAAVADSAVRAVRNELPPEPELTTATLRAPDDEPGDAALLVAYAGSLLLFMSLAFYGQWVVSGVVEEKSNRVVEVILSAVRPRDLLAGKVIGIGSLGFVQLVLVVGFAAALLLAGVFDAPASLGADVALVVPWFVLGYALYAVAYAIAGALAGNQQGAETAAQPVTYALLAVYFASYIVLAADAEGPLASFLTVFPLTAPLVLPARSALVGVPLWQHALAIVLVLAAIYALVRFAGRVYALGLLHGGSGLGLRAAWRIAREH